MNPELIKIAQQLMQQNPGMTPEQALRQAEQITQRMSEGERSEDFVGGQAREAGRLGHMAQQQYEARQAQQQQQPGLLGGIQPQQQQMRPHQLPIQQPQQRAPSHPMCGTGTSFDGQQCVSDTLSVRF